MMFNLSCHVCAGGAGPPRAAASPLAAGVLFPTSSLLPSESAALKAPLAFLNIQAGRSEFGWWEERHGPQTCPCVSALVLLREPLGSLAGQRLRRAVLVPGQHFSPEPAWPLPVTTAAPRPLTGLTQGCFPLYFLPQPLDPAPSSRFLLHHPSRDKI